MMSILYIHVHVDVTWRLKRHTVITNDKHVDDINDTATAAAAADSVMTMMMMMMMTMKRRADFVWNSWRTTPVETSTWRTIWRHRRMDTSAPTTPRTWENMLR